MKIRDRLLKMLDDRAIFQDDAKAILERYLASQMGNAMKDRMDDDDSGYSPVLMASVWTGVKAVAVQWMDENAPEHWARPMFLPGGE